MNHEWFISKISTRRPPCSPPCSGSPSSVCPSQGAPTAAPVLCRLKRSLLKFSISWSCFSSTSINLTEKFSAGARWWRRRWKYLRKILLWKIISRISKALTGVDIFAVSCISWAVHVWGWGEGCMMVTVSGERSCKSAELGLQQKTNSGFHKVKTLQRHKNDLVSQNCPCLSLRSRSREPFKYCFFRTKI